MILQFQDSYFDSCYEVTVWGYNAPDFKKVAIAYGIESYFISNPEEIECGLVKLWENPSQPFLFEFSINIHTKSIPENDN